MNKLVSLILLNILFSLPAVAQRSEFLLEKNWKFAKGDIANAAEPKFDDSKWKTVAVPHDWAIFGPFDRSHDLQNVAVTQNFEKKASVKTGRTGDFLMQVLAGIVQNSMFLSANRQLWCLTEQ